jgi:hypothetical protein
MMRRDFPDHITLQEVQGQYMKWYRDLYQYGAYYTSNVLHIRTITPPIGIFLPFGQSDSMIVTHRRKPVYPCATTRMHDIGDATLRYAGERYISPFDRVLNEDNSHLRHIKFDPAREDVWLFLEHPESQVLVTGRLSLFPHAKSIAKALEWIQNHFEICRVEIRGSPPIGTRFSHFDPFWISFAGWLKPFNVLSTSEQKTPFSKDQPHESGWCRYYNRETKRYCEELTNIPYKLCHKHPQPSGGNVITSETDRHIQANMLRPYDLGYGHLSINEDGYKTCYNLMNEEVIPCFF